jgi:hypothetical protein
MQEFVLRAPRVVPTVRIVPPCLGPQPSLKVGQSIVTYGNGTSKGPNDTGYGVVRLRVVKLSYLSFRHCHITGNYPVQLICTTVTLRTLTRTSKRN